MDEGVDVVCEVDLDDLVGYVLQEVELGVDSVEVVDVLQTEIGVDEVLVLHTETGVVLLLLLHTEDQLDDEVEGVEVVDVLTAELGIDEVVLLHMDDDDVLQTDDTELLVVRTGGMLQLEDVEVL